MSFSSNLKKTLLEEYKYKTELHAHSSPASPCSEVSPEELAKAYHEKGFDALVLANHFFAQLTADLTKDEAIDRYLKDYEETKKAAQKYGLTVILATEIRFTENNNDYLIYGVDRDILSMCYDYFDKGLEAFRKNIDLPKSVFIQAHPFRNGMEMCNPELLDGIETFNMHPGHNSRVGIAVKYAGQNNLAITTAGSDFHHPNREHEAVSALRTKVVPKDSFHLAEILKSGDYIFEIGENAIVLP